MTLLSRLLLSAKQSCPVVLLTLALLIPTNAFALFIDVVSQEYSISGEGFGYGPGVLDPKHVTYDKTEGNPLSSLTSASIEFQGGMGSGVYSIFTQAGGGFTSQNASVDVHVQAMDEGLAYSWGQASATMTFRPLVTSMLVNPYYSEPGELVSLIDLTTNQILLAINEWENNRPYLLSFDLSHRYAMSVESGQINFAGLDMSITIQSVPEPSTMLFLGTGLLGLACWGRNRIRKSNA